MKEFTLNRLPEFDVQDAEGATTFIAFGRLAEEEEDATPVPFVMVPYDLWMTQFGNAAQINIQLTR